MNKVLQSIKENRPVIIGPFESEKDWAKALDLIKAVVPECIYQYRTWSNYKTTSCMRIFDDSVRWQYCSEQYFREATAYKSYTWYTPEDLLTPEPVTVVDHFSVD